MTVGWAEALSPKNTAVPESEVFSLMNEDEYVRSWYCFRDSGKVYYDTYAKVGENRYVFGEDGVYIKGWIYDMGEGQVPRYIKVDDDTPDSDKAVYAQAPENYMFGLWDSGALAVSRWFDAIKPEDDEDADTRSFYADASGHIATGASDGHGVSIAARRKARKLGEIGTYVFENWSTDVNIMRTGGKLYCVEDSGTRLDGVLHLSGGEQGGSYPNGFYALWIMQP